MANSVVFRQFSHHQSMDLVWLWLIIPGSYILVSIIFLCFPFCHKHRCSHPILAALTKTGKILCIGHRGGGFEGPENTLQLFRKTDKLSHMFELDVCETKDHHLVVHHDTHLNRTTGKDKNVSDYALEEMPKLQKEIQAFGTVEKLLIITEENKIPTLDELFKEFPDKLMNIDLKTPTDTAIAQFGRLVRLHQREKNTVWGAIPNQGCTKLRESYEDVSCFYSGWEIFKIFLLCVSGLLPFWPLRPGVLDIPLYTDTFGEITYRFAGTSCKKVLVCIVLQLIRFFNLISRLFIPHLRKRGILTFYWILNEEEDWQRAISMGCQGIMTDSPTELAKYLKQKGLFFQEEDQCMKIK